MQGHLRFCAAIGSIVFCSYAFALTPIADTPFTQEFHEPYPLSAGDANDVRAVAVADDGTVWAGTKADLFALRDGQWTSEKNPVQGPVFDLFKDKDGTIYAGAWNGVYRISSSGVEHIAGVDGPVAVVGRTTRGLIAMGPDGSWETLGGAWKRVKDSWSRDARSVATDTNGNDWLGTGMGLYRRRGDEVKQYYKATDIFSGYVNALAIDSDQRLWVGEWGGLEVFENGTRIARVHAEQGLPNTIVTALAFAPDGVLWIGTELGVTRFSGNVQDLSLLTGTPEEATLRYTTDPDAAPKYNPKLWSLRHSKRWLLSDTVRDIAFDKDGNAWIATSAGVSAIKRKTMTMAQKAEYFQDILEKRHVREPGFVEKIVFPDINDKTKWKGRDDDNDGEFTSQYLVMESCRYAVTKDPKAKANAKRAFEALKYLQTITDTDGFFARTCVPIDWTEVSDKNETITPQMAADRRLHDPRYKQVEVRWRKSNDGKWLWKGDTSSDEMTGHMFGYLYYFDLVADADEKKAVAKHVAKIIDYVIDGGYVLRDIDGKATRWAVWSPEKLLHDPDWRVESSINAWEILSYLKCTYHMTGNEKYQREYLKLLNGHNYKQFLTRPRSFGRSEWIQFDDSLLLEAAPALVLYEKDPAIRALIMEGLSWQYRSIQFDQNLMNDFIFGGVTKMDIDADTAIWNLRDTPLDLLQWEVDNSKREDLRIVHRPMHLPPQLSRILPPSERGVMRWDKNTWDVNGGDFPGVDAKGATESSGAYWLLPYWMGRYYGYIAAP
jgi:hypothetical protein